MKELKKLSVFIFIILPALVYGDFVKSKSGNLLYNKMNDGSIILENSKIKVVVQPKLGGRVLSIMSKSTLEELVQPVLTNSLNIGGVLLDAFSLSYPDSALRNYSVKALEFSKSDDKLVLELNYNPGETVRSRNGLSMTKKITLDDSSSAIHIALEFNNNAPDPVTCFYTMQNYTAFGSIEQNGKTIFMPVDNDTAEIPFNPYTGSHGSRLAPTDGFFGITAKESRSSLALLFDKDFVQALDTVHEGNNASMDFYFRSTLIPSLKKIVYEIDAVVLPEMKSISGGSLRSGVVASINAQLKAGKVAVDGSLYKYTKESLPGLKLKAALYDSSDALIQNLKEETIAMLNPEESQPFTLTSDALTKVKGNFCKLVLKVTDEEGIVILTTEKKVKLNDPAPADLTKQLPVNFVWVMHQPLFPTPEATMKNLENTAAVYSNLIAVYEKHPLMKADIAVSGILLYQLMQYYPDLIEKIKALSLKKTWNILCTGFSYPMMPLISKDSAGTQIKMDRDLKGILFGVKPSGIFFPEGAYQDGLFESIIKNEVSWGYFSEYTLIPGYKTFPGTDYYAPSRVVSAGFGLNALVANAKPAEIIQKKADTAVDEMLQHMSEIQDKNKEGKRAFVIACKAEWAGNPELLDKLLTRLEKTKWVKVSTGEDIFKTVFPTQTFLGEKFKGGWYFDRELDETSLRPWLEPEQKTAILDKIVDVENVLARNKEKIQQARDAYPEQDFSYPLNLFEEGLERLAIAVQPNWLYGNNSKNSAVATNQLESALKLTAGVYDSLINIIKGKKSDIPTPKELGTKVAQDEKDHVTAKVPANKFQIWDRVLDPLKFTSFSSMNIRFRMNDKVNGIDFNSVYVYFTFTDNEEWYKVKAKMVFNGSLKANLGNAKSGDEIKYFIYGKDRKGNESASDKYIVTIE